MLLLIVSYYFVPEDDKLKTSLTSHTLFAILFDATIIGPIIKQWQQTMLLLSENGNC